MTQSDSSPVHDSRKCGGKRRGPDSEGKLCTRPAGWGTAHPGTGRCKLHGGSTASHKAAGRVAMANAAVATFGLPREIDPRDALLEEIYRTAGAVDWLHEQVQMLEAEQVTWGKSEEVDKGAGEFTGVDTTHRSAINVWVELWQKERKHLVDVSKAAIAAGLEERKVRLAEQQGAMLASVIKNILGDLDLNADQQRRVAEVVPRHLRAVA
jgi:hypothetical protein